MMMSVRGPEVKEIIRIKHLVTSSPETIVVFINAVSESQSPYINNDY